MKVILCAWMFTLVSLTVQAGQVDSEFDIVIRGGKVLDGAGNPWVKTDIAIRDGLIVQIGDISGKGVSEVDATGLYVSPGWIDMMDQSGRVLLKSGLAPNKINMGVTSLISGEAGTPVPAGEIGSYFDRLEQQGIAVNFGTYYSATQARVAVMGDGAADPTAEQLEQMKALVAKAMENGAMGITTALIYPPSAYHKTENLIELSKVVADYNGLYASHIRGESAELLQAVDEAIEIGEKSGAGVEIFHLKAAFYPNWGKDMPAALKRIADARHRGVDVAADVYPYNAGGTGLEITAPTWVYAEGVEKALESLRDPELRKRMKAEIAAGPTDSWTNLVFASGGWGNVVLANSYSARLEPFHGKDFKAIGEALGQNPADVAWDLMLEVYPKRPLALYFMMNEPDVELALQAPFVSIGSDAASAMREGDLDDLGLPHPRSYGTFPRIIGQYVRDKGVLSLPDAIRKMTSWPASRMGLSNRGLIKVGLAADITIFDLDTIKDTATWAQPTAKPEGIRHVIVNGEIVMVDGERTVATPGVVLRGPGAIRHKN